MDKIAVETRPKQAYYVINFTFADQHHKNYTEDNAHAQTIKIIIQSYL